MGRTWLSPTRASTGIGRARPLARSVTGWLVRVTDQRSITYSLPRVMEQRSITWIERSNRPTKPRASNQPTPRARPAQATRSTPRCPTDPATPDIAPVPLPPHASSTGEHRFLLYLAPPHHRRAPLPPPPVASPASAPASSAPVPHKMTKKS
jgi:hypothetical protein